MTSGKSFYFTRREFLKAAGAAAAALAAGPLLGACGGQGEAASVPPAASAAPAPATTPTPPAPAPAPVPSGPVEHPDPSLPVSKRIQGRWRLDIDKVQNIALTKQFRDLKKQGKGKQLLIEYTVSDTEFVLTTSGERGPVTTRFDYEIASEGEDTMLLKRIAANGESQQINIVLHDDDVLRMGTGSGEVPLQRVALPERIR